MIINSEPPPSYSEGGHSYLAPSKGKAGYISLPLEPQEECVAEPQRELDVTSLGISKDHGVFRGIFDSTAIHVESLCK